MIFEAADRLTAPRKRAHHHWADHKAATNLCSDEPCRSSSSSYFNSLAGRPGTRAKKLLLLALYLILSTACAGGKLGDAYKQTRLKGTDAVQALGTMVAPGLSILTGFGLSIVCSEVATISCVKSKDSR